MNHERLGRLAHPALLLLSLCLALAGMTGCASGTTNPFASRVHLTYLMVQTADTETRSLDVEGVAGILRDDVSNLKAEARLETSTVSNLDGTTTTAVTHVVTLGGEQNTNSGNQFKALDSIIGFLGGLFAGALAP